MFYWLSRVHIEKNIEHIWSFIEVVHDKGEHDEASACVKRALAREKLKFGDVSKFKNAPNIMELCSTTLSTRSSENSTIKQYFWLVE